MRSSSWIFTKMSLTISVFDSRFSSVQRCLQFLLHDGLDCRPNPLPHQFLERAFSLPASDAADERSPPILEDLCQGEIVA